MTIPPGSDRARVLVVDDEASIREMLGEFLTLEGYQVATAEDGLGALELLDRTRFDLVLTDLKMPRMGGIRLLEQLGKIAPGTMAVIMTGFGTVETAIDAMKRGAHDYVLKPFKLDEVLHVVQRAIERRRIEAENIRRRQALSLFRVSEAISASLSVQQVLDTVETACLGEIRADLVSTWLCDEAGGHRERHRQLSERQPAGPDDVGELDPAPIAQALGTGEPLLAHGIEAQRFFERGVTAPLSSLMAVPLTVEGRSLGFIAVGTLSPGPELEEGQRKLLSIIASRAAASIENARLYRDLQDTFQQTIEGLARAIDKMDRYTAGHSKRVARYAVFLAREIGQTVAQAEVVRQSALMHDIGKIGCSVNLNKPGRLTDDEYETFKRHPVIGCEILGPIKFLQPLVPGVQLHHERHDGRGYPLGLAGDDIPLLARIISVADTYDAMTSDRSYRRALPHEVALAEIERCSGTQFHPDLVAPFAAGIVRFRQELLAAGVRVPE